MKCEITKTWYFLLTLPTIIRLVLFSRISQFLFVVLFPFHQFRWFGCVFDVCLPVYCNCSFVCQFSLPCRSFVPVDWCFWGLSISLFRNILTKSVFIRNGWTRWLFNSMVSVMLCQFVLKLCGLHFAISLYI